MHQNSDYALAKSECMAIDYSCEEGEKVTLDRYTSPIEFSYIQT